MEKTYYEFCMQIGSLYNAIMTGSEFPYISAYMFHRATEYVNSFTVEFPRDEEIKDFVRKTLIEDMNTGKFGVA